MYLFLFNPSMFLKLIKKTHFLEFGVEQLEASDSEKAPRCKDPKFTALKNYIKYWIWIIRAIFIFSRSNSSLWFWMSLIKT